MGTRKKLERASLPEIVPWMIEFLRHGCVKKPDGLRKSPRPYLYMREFNGCFALNWASMWKKFGKEIKAMHQKECGPDAKTWAETQLEGGDGR